MRGTLGDIDPVDKVPFKRTTSGGLPNATWERLY